MLGFRGAWEMHQSTCTVIKDQIKLISDNSPGEHLSRATYKKMSYLWKIRGAGGLHEYLTSALFPETEINIRGVTTVTDRERVISSVSQVKMVKWPPSIIIYPVKPSYFIVQSNLLIAASTETVPAAAGMYFRVLTIGHTSTPELNDCLVVC